MSEEGSEEGSVRDFGQDVRDVVQETIVDVLGINVIGFTEEEIIHLIINDFVDFEVFLFMDEKDVKDLADSFAKRTIDAGRVIFGFQRMKMVKGFMHWVQDQWRVNLTPEEFPTVIGKAEIVQTLKNAEIRKNHKLKELVASVAADPGKLTKNVEFHVWIRGFYNFLSTIPGIDGHPLHYVIRDEEKKIPVVLDYLTNLAILAPLEGDTFDQDNKIVF
jgi:hypothetical protein